MTNNTTEMYVTDDGAFGDAFGLRTFTTEHWTPSEWAAFYAVDEGDRMRVAIEIDARVWTRLNESGKVFYGHNADGQPKDWNEVTR